MASVSDRTRLLDALAPFLGVLQQVLDLDRLAHRYRFTVYPSENHLSFALMDKFDDPVSHMGTGLRPDTLPSLTLNLVGVAGLTVDPARAGLAAMPRSTIAVATAAVEIKLAALPPGVTVRLDDNPTAPR